MFFLKSIVFSVVLVGLASCQLQANKPLQPTVRIPPKVAPPTTEPEAPPNKLIGTWKSNRELTWLSINDIEGISEDALKYLQENVFGLLAREFTATNTRAYFGTAKTSDASSEFGPYKIVEETEERYVIEHTDPLTNKQITSTLYWENDCYYEIVSKWQYKEYFCRDQNSGKKFIAVPKSYQRQQQ